MNGNLRPFLPAKLDLPPMAEFIDKMLKLGLSLDEAERTWNQLQFDEVFKNDEYQVNVDKRPSHGFDEFVIWHLSIKRLDKCPIHDWRDLQAIKNMLVGPQYEAIELYPSERRVVDTANQYHLWVFVKGEQDAPILPIGWTSRAISDVADARLLNAKQRRLPRRGGAAQK